MADLSKLLEQIAKGTKSAQQLDMLSESLQRLKSSASTAQEAIQIEKYNKAVQQLITTETRRARLQEMYQRKIEAGMEITDAFTEAVERNEKQHKQAANTIQSALRQRIAAHRQAEKAIHEHNEAMEAHWKQNTLLGKAWDAGTSTLAKFTAGVTAGGLAMKALTRFTEAATLRQELMIRSFRGLDKGIDDLGRAAEETYDFSEAMREAEMTAHRLGVSTAEIAPTMEKFARITGSDNPRALGKLTEATMAVAKSLNLDTADAFEYVSKRMDKFGGNASSAIMHLQNMRKSTEEINKSFGRTVLRGDDVAKTLLEIARESTIYAMDQRAVTNVLKDNILRLQSLGMSYDQARKRAENFTGALTKDAPEWMKILAGEEVMSSLRDSMEMVTNEAGEAVYQLTGDMRQALEEAKPGLAKEIETIMKDTDLSEYDKSRIIQEMVSGTEVGMQAMNRQILKTVETSGANAASVIRNQFNVTYEEALRMIDSAKEFQEIQDEIASVRSMEVDQIAKRFNVTAAEAQQLKDNKDSLKSMLQIERERKQAADMGGLREEQKKTLTEQREAIQAQIDKLKERKKTASEGMQELLGREERQLKLKLEELRPKEEESLENINKTLLDIKEGLLPSSVLSGRMLKELVSMFSGVGTLIAGAAALLIIPRFFRTLGADVSAIRNFLMRSSMGGGGGFIGGARGRGMRRAGRAMRRLPGGRLLRRLPGGRMLTRGAMMAGGALGELGGVTKGLGGLATKGLGGLAKGAGGLLRGAGKAIPILGTLASVGLAAKEFMGADTAKGKGKAIGGGLGGAGGAAAGAALGTLIFPGVGTLIGAGLGGWLGGEGGEYLGGTVGEAFGPSEMAQGIAATQGMNSEAGALAATARSQAAATGAGMAATGGKPSATFGPMGADGSLTLNVTNAREVLSQVMGYVQTNRVRSG